MERLKFFMQGLGFAVLISIIFIAPTAALKLASPDNIYKLVHEKPNGQVVVYERIEDYYEYEKKSAVKFKDMNTGEYVTITDGTRKLYLVENRIVWDSWKKNPNLQFR